MADLRRCNSVNLLQSLLYCCLTVRAHHSFNLKCFSHSVFSFSAIFRGVVFICKKLSVLVRLHTELQLLIMNCIVNLHEVEPQRVRYNAEARKTHGRSAEHRVHRDPECMRVGSRCHRYQQRIIKERPEQVLKDILICVPAEPYSCGDIREAALHEDNVRRVDCHVRSRPDRDTCVRSRKCRRIVNAIADHSHLVVVRCLSS